MYRKEGKEQEQEQGGGGIHFQLFKI